MTPEGAAFDPNAITYFDEHDVYQYDYVVCDDGPWLGKLKSYFLKYNVPFFTQPTEDEDIVGLIVPLGEGSQAIDQQAYQQVVNSADTWGTLMDGFEDDGMNCTGQPFQ